MANSLARAQGAIGARLGEGLAFLATVGSTAPFIGLFGTVVGIYRALIKIGASGQASIDTVAGPVGEALIMTALGLVVAVPAVLAYNWLIRRNKSIMEDLAAFTNDLHGYLMSEGKVKPRGMGARQRRFGGRQGGADPLGAAPTPAGTEPLTHRQTSTGAAGHTGTTTVGSPLSRVPAGADAGRDLRPACTPRREASAHGNECRQGRRRRRPHVRHQHHAARGRDAGAADHLPDRHSGRGGDGSGALPKVAYEAT
jgi:hypothetical protein